MSPSSDSDIAVFTFFVSPHRMPRPARQIEKNRVASQAIFSVKLHIRFHLIQQHVAINFSTVAPYRISVLVDKERRNGFNAGLTGSRFVLIYVKLIYRYPPFKNQFDLLNYRHHFLAMRTPGGKKFH